MWTARGKRRLISIRCQKGCVESKLNGQMNSHSDYIAHVRVVQNSVVKDDFDLHYFQFKINIAIFGIFYILN